MEGSNEIYEKVVSSGFELVHEYNDKELFPCPFCGEYPTLKEELDENDERIYAVEHECNIDMTTGWNHDRQTVIDNWNRRA